MVFFICIAICAACVYVASHEYMRVYHPIAGLLLVILGAALALVALSNIPGGAFEGSLAIVAMIIVCILSFDAWVHQKEKTL